MILFYYLYIVDRSTGDGGRIEIQNHPKNDCDVVPILYKPYTAGSLLRRLSRRVQKLPWKFPGRPRL